MLGAELGLFAAGHAVRRPLVAAGLRAPLADHIDHAFQGVMNAELRLLAPRRAVGGSLDAAVVATPFAAHVHHPGLGVRDAEFRLLAAGHAVRGMLGAPLEVAPLADYVDHVGRGMGGAELCSPRPNDSEGAYFGARPRLTNHHVAETVGLLQASPSLRVCAQLRVRQQERGRKESFQRLELSEFGRKKNEGPTELVRGGYAVGCRPRGAGRFVMQWLCRSSTYSVDLPRSCT